MKPQLTKILFFSTLALAKADFPVAKTFLRWKAPDIIHFALMSAMFLLLEKQRTSSFFCHIYSVFAGSVRELHSLFRKFRRLLMNCAVGLVRLGPNKARTTAFCSTTLSLTGSLPLKLPLCCTKVSCSRPKSSERFGSKV